MLEVIVTLDNTRDLVQPVGKKAKFWQFTWHEIGISDLPHFIDYILSKTNSPALHYVGHSQGATVFLIMASMYPEYNKKIKSMHALGPVVFLNNLKENTLIPILVKHYTSLKSALRLLGFHEFTLSNNLLIS